MMELKKRTRKAFGIRKKEKDNDSGSPDRDGGRRSPSQQTPVPEDTTALFGPPLDTAFGEQKSEPPPLPPKNVPTSPPTTGPPSADDAVSTEADSSTRKPSIADLDNIFGPEQSVPPGEEAGETWVCFSEESPDRPPLPKDPAPPLPTSPPPPEEPAPPLPASPPPPESPAPPLPTSPPPPEDPAPPLPTSPPPKEDPVPPVPTSPLPTEEPAAPPVRSGPSTPEDRNPLVTSPPPAPKELASPPASSPPPIDSPASVPPAPAPNASTPPAVSPPTEEPTARSVPPPLVLSEEEQPKNTDTTQPKEDGGETVTSPKDSSQGSRTTPPPPPPPTYRAVVSSPGPTSGTGGSNSSSSPVRPATPSSVNPTPPPPPPRPPSRPKLPPGKPTAGDANRPFSPPIHSASPPPIAPLARAESTSSISSTNSLSAATTPTVNKELSVSVSDDAYVDKLPTFGRHFDSFACSRGPSPLTMGAQDTLPVAAAFTETVNAFFKGADPNCVVKIIGEMVLSFPAGITRHFANNPSPAVLTFSITNYSRLEHVLPNPQLLCDTTTQCTADAKNFWVNMPNLISHLKKVAEQKPQATYYNVDMLKYQGPQSTPLNLAVSWRCEPTSTDLRIDYKYNGEAMSTAMALNNVQFLVPVDGGVSKLQAVLPPAANAEQQRILWKIPDISQKSENGVGSLLARFQLTEGPSKPAPLAVQFTSEGSTLSGCDIELAGPGYRFSLVKKRFAA
uniref:SH3GL interacting endocytic adaptor 1 n=1 Tax=Amphiprion percula TaxID=161767 RepID=A0A3P8SNW8_AMPPE